MYPYQCDLADISSVQSMFEWIKNHPDLGRLNICICNAGFAIAKPLTELSPEEMKGMTNVNVISSAFCAQMSIKMMLDQEIDGQVIFIGSTMGNEIPDDFKMSFYSSTKHALKVLMEGFRKEMKSLGSKIRIGSISPGLVKTEALEAMTQNAEIAQMIYETNPHINADDLTEILWQMITCKPYVQVQDVTVRHVHDKL